MPPNRDPEQPQAVMIVGGWSTECSACRRSTAWTEEGHTTILGYGPDNGTPGCGARWTGIAWVYGEPAEWPSHMPEWMQSLVDCWAEMDCS